MKELVSSIGTMQKGLVVAAATLMLFLLAPYSDPLQRAAQKEIVGVRDTRVIEKIGAAVRSDGVTEKAVAGLLAEIKKEGLFDVSSTSVAANEETRNALGFVAPATLGDLVRVLSGDVRYCKPRVDENVLRGIATLQMSVPPYGAKTKPIRVTRAQLHPARDGECVAAVTSLQDAALKAAAKRKEPPEKPDVIPVVSPPEPRKVILVAGRNEPNPAWSDWNSKREQVARAKAQAEKDQEILEQREGESRRAASALLDKMLLLERLVAMRACPGAGPIRYTIATLDVDDMEDLDGNRLTSVQVPVWCEPAPLVGIPGISGAAPTPVLPTSQIIEQWATLRDLTPQDAAAVLDATLRKGEESVEIVGFKVRERYVALVGPMLLAMMLLWYVIHLWSLRKAVRRPLLESAIGQAARALPITPHGRNLPISVFTSGAVIAASLWLGVRVGPGGAWVWIPISISIAMATASIVLVATIRPSRGNNQISGVKGC
ncbi:MAG: hypothetical protein PHU25_22130 [Deltaproteobacteria bacterium]|nr:hypothetical protein [Deltaproteobacteria bacterium]